MSLLNTKQKIRQHKTLFTTDITGRGKWNKSGHHSCTCRLMQFYVKHDLNNRERQNTDCSKNRMAHVLRTAERPPKYLQNAVLVRHPTG